VSTPWNPAGLAINPHVAKGLKEGKVVWDNRFTGKTETLLAYIALHHTDAILVSKTMDLSNISRRRWKERYPQLIEPRFLTWVQLKNRPDGMSGIVFSDEVPEVQNSYIFRPPVLRFGGGVYS